MAMRNPSQSLRRIPQSLGQGSLTAQAQIVNQVKSTPGTAARQVHETLLWNSVSLGNAGELNLTHFTNRVGRASRASVTVNCAALSRATGSQWIDMTNVVSILITRPRNPATRISTQSLSPPLSSRAKVERGADQKNHRIDDLQNSGAHQVHLRLRLEHAPEGPDQGGRESDEYEEAQATGEDQGQQRDEEK